MWHLWCPYLFLISPSFGASGGLCFVIVVPQVASLIFVFKNELVYNLSASKVLLIYVRERIQQQAVYMEGTGLII